ncbi:unnamed protein product [Callosobruchus maculatus]|uniref:Vesicular, overexpressed in cancer, prosurvival protein 1 n=1 Tax=Callosobruchus maculatus TaxID=64391 RepID=A0A653CNM0_CALMS|nr:unnamed protein product [Callosobruchus maculatus]
MESRYTPVFTNGPPVKLCPFVTELGELDHYICLRSERCCAHGCCFDSSSKYYFQSWYFWLLILVIFGTFYFLTWYCKRIERRRKRRAALTTHAYLLRPPSAPNTNPSPNNEFVDLTDEIILGRILEENIAANRGHESSVAADITCHVAPPPKYAEAVNMPKLTLNPTAPPSDHQVHRTDSEPLPTYDSVVKKPNGNKDDSHV